MKKTKFKKILIFVVCICIFCSNLTLIPHATAMAASYESAWFPISTMNITQLAYESYSHSNSKHIDCVGNTYAYAPFTGKVVYTSSNFGVTLFQSLDKVYYADGSLDYMTVMFMHGTSLFAQGTTVSQGTQFYKIGGLGANGQQVYALHYDIGVYRGQKSTPTNWYSEFGNTFAFDAFFINPNKTTSIVKKGIVAYGNTVYNGAPTNWSNLWRTLGDTTKINVTYQVYDSVSKKWLANVTNNSDYAGIFGNPISGIYANLSKGNITYKVHVKGGSWLPAVTNRTDYAGITSQPIDGLMMTTDTGKTIYYRVHLKSSNSWLPYVTGYNQNDSNNGYAGIFGQEIDGIQIDIQ